MTGEGRFAPTEHLASEAVVAYVDGELRMNAYLRAAEHLSRCPECAAEVEAQQQTRVALRRAAQMQISAPIDLHDSLSRIPLANPTGSSPENMSRGTSYREIGFESRRWTGWWRK
ncbi:hypothetical protein [Nocardia vermiculata]|uniref:RNA polymerase subunit sigma-70 n=1 Tax=Nocardia vermiculata TaxID=257274 RepID=A0A846XT49_9NOCA|nr:hypothetical protein [Nocardia vermiculata]NKY49050.1 hypothetical protein [Nocardia vermiculata]